MATTYAYYYTLQIFGNTESGNNASVDQIDAVDYSSVMTNPGSTWIQIMPEATSLTVPAAGKRITLQTNNEVKVQVRFYQVVTTGSGSAIHWLDSSVVKDLRFTLADAAALGNSTNNHVSLNTQGSGSTSISTAYDDGTVFYFYFKPATAGSISVPLLSYNNGGIVPADGSGGSLNGDTNNSYIFPTLAGYSPILTISKKPPTPPVPSLLENALVADATAGGKVYMTFYPCPTPGYPGGAWYGLAVTPIKASSSGKPMYTYSTYTCTPNNTKLTNGIPPTSEAPAATGKVDTTQVSKILAQFKEYALGICGGITTVAGNGATSTGAAAVTPNPSFIAPPTINDQWNPPVYSGSRNPSFSEIINQGNVIFADTGSNAFKRGLQADIPLILSAMSSSNQGRIFQDSLSASTLNSYQSSLALKGTSPALQWGFRFMYNPTTFSYNSSSNNSVDWTNGSSDPSALLVGNSQVTFDLYLNRILDMTALDNAVVRGVDPTTSDIGYGRPLSKDEVYGILYRGTEYDIEFLYRVLNGSPVSGSTLLSDAYKSVGGVTSDFGYTTAVPCWLWLHDNLRYFGAVAGIQVNHVMFDLRMVPILSVVSVTFSRYPSLNSSNTIFNEASIGQTGANVAAGTVAGTGTTP
jgi:hypothetical protein